MTKINRMPERINLKTSGGILLEYQGPNESFRNRKALRNAELFFCFIKPVNPKEKNLLFEVEFEEFSNIGLKLDFDRNTVTKLETNEIIGSVDLTQICYDNFCLILSGRYSHDSINLAYYGNDQIDFEVFFKPEPIFFSRIQRDLKRMLESLPHYQDITLKYI